MGSLRRSMSRQSLRYRTSTFPRSPSHFSSMVNIRSSLKLHRRSKTQPGEEEGGAEPRNTPINNIEEEEEENDAIREEITAEVKKQEVTSDDKGLTIYFDVKKPEDKNEDNDNDEDGSKQEESRESNGLSTGDISIINEERNAEKTDIESDTNNITCYVDENGIHGVDEQISEDELQCYGVVEDEGVTVNGHEENGEKSKVEIIEVTDTNGHFIEEEEEEEEEGGQGYVGGSTLLDDDNWSALQPVRLARNPSTVSGDLTAVREEDEEDGREDGAGNPFEGLEDSKEVPSGTVMTNGKGGRSNGAPGKPPRLLESHFDFYDNKKNPFLEEFDAS